MYTSLIRSFSFLLLFSPLVVSGLQRRQKDSPVSSIPIPTFTYGYYSQVYPNGEAATRANAASASASTATNPSTTGKAPSNPEPSSGWQSDEFGAFAASQGGAFVASMCSPIDKETEQPDMIFPCNKIIDALSQCSFGKVYQELVDDSDSDNVATSPRNLTDQLECFCAQDGPGQQYWQNNIYCSECRRLHGANIQNYAPVPYVKAFSSAYCAQAPTNVKGLGEYAMLWTSTASISLAATGSFDDILGTSTDVSLYTASSGPAASTTAPSVASSSSTGSTTATSPIQTVSAGSTSGADPGRAGAPAVVSIFLGFCLLGMYFL